MQIKELIWDNWNEEHIRRRSITKFDVETVLIGTNEKPLIEKSRRGTLAAWGIAKGGKYLLVILAPREIGSYYPVTARVMKTKERRRYQKWLR